MTKKDTERYSSRRNKEKEKKEDKEKKRMVCRDRKPFAYTFSTVFLTLTTLDLPTLINFASPISK